MTGELHLFVIWSKGRFAQDRILADIRSRFEVVHVCEIAFPGKAAECYCRFYNTRRFNVRKKVSRCGKGPFLVVIVRVGDSRTVTDQYGKTVNAAMYGCKDIYRQWCGGKFRVHGTLQSSEFERDVRLLTGHSADEWELGVPDEISMDLPPFDSIPPPPKNECWVRRLLRHMGVFRKKG